MSAQPPLIDEANFPVEAQFQKQALQTTEPVDVEFTLEGGQDEATTKRGRKAKTADQPADVVADAPDASAEQPVEVPATEAPKVE